MAQPKKLQVNAAHILNDPVVFTARLVTVCLRAVRQECPLRVYIYFAEKMMIHKIEITLVIVSGQPFVLVQVNCCDTGEIKIPFPVSFHQIGIRSNRG